MEKRATTTLKDLIQVLLDFHDRHGDMPVRIETCCDSNPLEYVGTDGHTLDLLGNADIGPEWDRDK